MKITHNTCNLEYRNPFGAVECGTEVLLAVRVVGADDLGRPLDVKLRLWDDGAERIIPMERGVGDAAPYNDGKIGATVGDGVLDVPTSKDGILRADDICPYNVAKDFDVTVGADIIRPKDDDGYFYYAKIKCEKPQLLWYFFVIDGMNFGVNGELQEGQPNSFQITVYDKGYEAPKWWGEQVVYQIFVDRFAHGGTTPSTQSVATPPKEGNFKNGCEDYEFHQNWNEEVSSNIHHIDFFGGNLNGIIEKLDYLEDLGVTCIYLNPIFEAHSNHKYDTGDYMKIDPMYGDERDFKRLCAEAKKKGISVILDGVFNHNGEDSVYFNKFDNYDTIGAYQSQNSPYYGWYDFLDYPDDYMSWWGNKSLPQVNELAPSYRSFMIEGDDSVMKHWTKAGARGWRLDVADELPDEFIRILRENLKGTKKDAVLVGEVWEDASNKVSYGEQREYFLGKELDGVINYPFKNAIIGFLKGEITSFEFNEVVRKIVENYPKQALYSSLNILGNHDTMRIRTALGDDKLYKLAILWQMTFMGVPCVYYGDEVGLGGEADPYNRRSFPWNSADLEIRDWYKKLIKMRKENADLVSEGYEFLPINDDVLGYKRGNTLVMINRSGVEQEYGKIKLSPFGWIVERIHNK